MKKIPYLARRGSVYRYRRRIPDDLRSKFTGPYFSRSLGTSDRSKAIERHAEIHLEIERKFARMRESRPITSEEIDIFYERHKARTLASLAADWANAPISQANKQLFDAVSGEVEPRLQQLRVWSDEGDYEDFHDLADAIHRMIGAEIDRTSKSYRVLCNSLMDAEIAALEESQNIKDSQDARRIGFSSPSPSLLPKAARGLSPLGTNPAAKHTQSPLQLLPDFLAENTDRRTKTNEELRTALRMLEEVIGSSKPVSDYRLEDASKFLTMLMAAPLRYKVYFGDVPLPKAVEANRACGANALEVLNPNTINDKWMSHTRAFFNWAKKRGFIKDNPFLELRAKGVPPAVGEPFSFEDLKLIFDCPAYRGCASPKNGVTRMRPGTVKVRDHIFWAPLIALYTGARLSEIGQLLCDDVHQAEGMWVFNFRTETPDGKRRSDASLKSLASKRRTPIHSTLISLGLLDYLKAVRTPEGRLFPDWQPCSKGTYSNGPYSKFLNRYFFPSFKFHAEGLTFHNFRHTLVTRLHRVTKNPKITSGIAGHAVGGGPMTYYYDHPSLSDLQEVVEQVSYPGLDLSHLIP